MQGVSYDGSNKWNILSEADMDATETWSYIAFTA